MFDKCATYLALGVRGIDVKIKVSDSEIILQRLYSLDKSCVEMGKSFDIFPLAFILKLVLMVNNSYISLPQKCFHFLCVFFNNLFE